MTTRAQLEAWEGIQPQLTKRQEAVLAIIRAMGGATLREIADALDVDMNAVSGRVTELQAAKAVRDSGQTRLNPKSQKHITVWVSAEPAKIGLFKSRQFEGGFDGDGREAA